MDAHNLMFYYYLRIRTTKLLTNSTALRAQYSELCSVGCPGGNRLSGWCVMRRCQM